MPRKNTLFAVTALSFVQVMGITLDVTNSGKK
jgi:hypothetical protein